MKPVVLFENDDMIVLNKPSGLLSIPDREGKEISLKVMLQEAFGQIFTVHRLDKDTSGAIVFAKNEAAHKFLSEAFENRTVEKYYIGIVMGEPAEDQKTMDGPIMEHPAKKGQMMVHQRGKASLTDYEVVERLKKFTLVKFQLHTGRTHQIRVHMANEGHPILVDPLYGDGAPILLSTYKKKFKLSKDLENERPIMGRLALHASELKLPLLSGETIEIIAPLPKEFSAFLNQFRKLYSK
ncbi:MULTISPECIES: RluA family pseudouridine synthase [unclassified Paraflavitalea]|uniref:RluA family pseudouridine synthase n=1 Tax=unclassified Paraflavitalea TaxID=2798305 RepID=UPI003D336675